MFAATKLISVERKELWSGQHNIKLIVCHASKQVTRLERSVSPLSISREKIPKGSKGVRSWGPEWVMRRSEDKCTHLVLQKRNASSMNLEGKARFTSAYLP